MLGLANSMNQQKLNSEIHNALTERIRSRSCEISDGTGNIIKYDGKIYIVTCKHIADDFFKANNSYVILRNNDRIYKNQLKYYCHTKDYLDIALISVLDNDLVKVYYELNDFDAIDDFNKYDFSKTNLFICGFPSQISFIKNSRKNILYLSYGTIISDTKPSDENFIYLSYNRESDSNITREGLITKLPEAPGLSGAFIFKVETFKGELTDIWQPSLAKIIAIQTDWNKKNWLKATNIKYLFGLLKQSS